MTLSQQDILNQVHQISSDPTLNDEQKIAQLTEMGKTLGLEVDLIRHIPEISSGRIIEHLLGEFDQYATFRRALDEGRKEGIQSILQKHEEADKLRFISEHSLKHDGHFIERAPEIRQRPSGKER